VGLISFEKKYIYNYTDHLGNFLLSYFNNGDGILQIKLSEISQLKTLNL